jgi:hypothetical protein
LIYSLIHWKGIDSVLFYANLHLLSRKRNNNTYNEGATKIYDIGRDKWDLFDVTDILEVASLSREEPKLDAAFSNDDGEGNNLTLFS